jgi:hypothetical protein
MVRKRWVMEIDRQQSGRGERYFDVTDKGADQLEYFLQQLQWLDVLGQERLGTLRRERARDSDRMKEWQDTLANH